MKQNQQWYAIRVTYSREMKLKTFLDKNKIENFLPMHYTLTKKKNKSIKSLVPVIHNLIFIKSDRKTIDTLKLELEAQIPMRYIIDKTTNLPIIIPEQQMKNFIAVAGTLNEQLLYLNDIDSNLERGDKVRIIGGIFSGIEGTIFRIKRDRRVVVSVKGVIAVATAFIPPSLVEKI